MAVPRCMACADCSIDVHLRGVCVCVHVCARVVNRVRYEIGRGSSQKLDWRRGWVHVTQLVQHRSVNYSGRCAACLPLGILIVRSPVPFGACKSLVW